FGCFAVPGNGGRAGAAASAGGRGGSGAPAGAALPAALRRGSEAPGGGGVMIRLRAMHLDDVPAVAALDARCIPTPWSAETFAAELSNPIGYYRVAERGGEVVGYLGAHVVLDEAHVVTVG